MAKRTEPEKREYIKMRDGKREKKERKMENDKILATQGPSPVNHRSLIFVKS